MNTPGSATYADTRSALWQVLNALPAASATDARSVPVRMALGTAARALGDLDMAGTLYAQVLTVAPKHEEALAGQIDAEIARGDHEAALGLCDAALGLRPKSALLQGKKAHVLQALDRRAEALDMLVVLHEAHPTHVPTLLPLANLRRAFGDLEAAEALYAQILDLEPGHEGGLVGQIDIALARGDHDAALEMCEAGQVLRPRSILLRRRQAHVLQAVGRRQEALDILEALHAAHPKRVPILLTLANLQRALGDLEAADALYAKLLELEPGHEGALVGQIDAALARGDHDAALDLCEAGRTHGPRSPLLRRRQAHVLQAVGRPQEALDILGVLQEAEPDHIPTTLALANLHRTLGDLETADALYAQVLSVEAANWPARRERAKIAEALGDIDTAIALLEQDPLMQQNVFKKTGHDG
ncbi:tetratricopeptide repeat protein [uncultured Tateyamaria sp.]|uniref:tetratricopeptide repeat protein n=1 Tax=uncultured Tateyamaria sp. TaxID=455651 RepID=UPI002622439D|nr:tetratricopeptide repeat protein [uncultured Tateyamaria sp.]